MTTKANLPAVKRDDGEDDGGDRDAFQGKQMYMAAGSGIPEIKTILSGFVIPHFLDFKVLVVKAVGASEFLRAMRLAPHPNSQVSKASSMLRAASRTKRNCSLLSFFLIKQTLT